MGARVIAAAAALIVTTGSAHAAEIDAMITTAMKAAVDELAPPFERASGHALRITYGPSGGLARRLNAGEAADLVVVDSKALDELIKQGKVVAGRTDVARTGIGIAVRKGAPKPDVSSPEALKRALLARCLPRNPSPTPRRPAAASPRPTSWGCSRSSASPPRWRRRSSSRPAAPTAASAC